MRRVVIRSASKRSFSARTLRALASANNLDTSGDKDFCFVTVAVAVESFSTSLSLSLLLLLVFPTPVPGGSTKNAFLLSFSKSIYNRVLVVGVLHLLVVRVPAERLNDNISFNLNVGEFAVGAGAKVNAETCGDANASVNAMTNMEL